MLERDRYKLAVAADQNVKEKEYWLRTLSGDLEKPVFPPDYRSIPGETVNHGQEVLSITGEAASHIKRLAKESPVKTFMIFTALIIVLLERYSGKQDILLGVPIYKQEEDLDFINTVLVIRTLLDEQVSFKELLLGVRKSLAQATENQNYPFEILIEQLAIPQVEGDYPLFDVAVMHQEIHDPAYISHIPVNILFSISAHNDDFILTAKYNPSVYLESTIRRILNHFQQLSGQLSANVEMPVFRAEILSQEERERILHEFNGNPQDFQKQTTLDACFRDSAKKHPHSVALIGPSIILEEEISLCYEQLSYLVLGLATELEKFGVVPGSVVAVIMEPSVETIALLLAVLTAGGAYLPIDPTSPEERISYILADSGVSLLVRGEKLELGLADEIPVFKIESLLGDLINRNDNSFKPGALHGPEHPAYIIYTSGSTGRPKGVVVEHGNVLAYIHAFFQEFHLDGDTVFLQQASYAFDAFVEEVYPVLFRGGKLVVITAEMFWDTNVFENYMAARRISAISVSPLFLKTLNDFPGLEKLAIDLYINGGDVLKSGYIHRLLNCGTVYNTYGPTETTVCATYYKCSPKDEEFPPIGKPITNWQVHIYDKYGRLLPIGVPGELCIQGEGVSRGYLNRPELTAHRFRDHIYHSGDLARWQEDGNIQFLGRIDHQVKIRGYRIELGEIESLLSRHEAIGEVAVIVKDSESENPLLCAYYTASPGWKEKIEKGPGEISDGLKEYLAKFLPHFMVPPFFLPLDSFPRTPTGKLDRKALPEPSLSNQREYIPPSNELEAGLVEIWAEVLGIEKEAVGIDDNFFDLGGQSLLLIKLNKRVNEVFEKEISIGNLFRLNTVRSMAEFITNEDVNLQADDSMLDESLETMEETLNLLEMDD